MIVASLPVGELDASRRRLLDAAAVPVLLVRPGLRPSGIAPDHTLTRFSWSLRDVPGWLAVLTHIDPVAYGVDPLRRVVLTALDVPAQTAAGIEILGYQLSLMQEVGIMAAFAVLMLIPAVRSFRVQE